MCYLPQVPAHTTGTPQNFSMICHTAVTVVWNPPQGQRPLNIHGSRAQYHATPLGLVKQGYVSRDETPQGLPADKRGNRRLILQHLSGKTCCILYLQVQGLRPMAVSLCVVIQVLSAIKTAYQACILHGTAMSTAQCVRFRYLPGG